MFPRTSADSRARCSRASRWPAAALVLLLATFGGLAADRETGYQGLPLAEALERLRDRGLRLIFSSAVIHEGMVVTVEPQAGDPAGILEEILASAGLRSRSGPGGSILILPGEGDVGHIRGNVASASRGAPVARARVAVSGTSAVATTRPDGSFELFGLPTDAYDLVVSAPGFAPGIVTSVRVAPGPPVELFIELKAEPTYVEDVVVTPGRLSIVRKEQTSALSLGNDDALFVPTIGGDVSRVIELLPGVAAPDNSAAFGIRGSSAGDVALFLDGLELYEPFHLHSLQSPFSFIDTEIVERIDFHGGGLTADFGDRHGGVVNMHTALPEGPLRSRLELGSLNSRFTTGAPMTSPNGSWLVSTRAWYPQKFRETIEFGEPGIDPDFADLYAKLAFNLSPKTVLSAHGLLAYDRLEFLEQGDGNERVDAQNKSAYVWLRALRSWSPSVTSETVLSTGRLDRFREGDAEPEDTLISVDDERVVDFVGLRHDSTWQISGSHLLRGGVEIRRLESRYRYSRTGKDPLLLNPTGTSHSAYVAHRTAISPRFATELGLRWDRQTYTEDNQTSPRFNARWRIGDRTELRLGVGRFFQSQRIHELRIEDEETAFLPAELSQQADATFQHRTSGGFQLRVDAYYRELSDLRPRYENILNPIELFPEAEFDRRMIPAEKARLRGLEILLRSRRGRPLTWWASYALSSAEDIVAGRNEPRKWDQTHAAKFLIGYRLDPKWSLSLAGTAHSGWPATPVTGEAVTQPDGSVEIVPVFGERNSLRFSDYYRLDVKVSRFFSLQRSRLRLDLEIVNVTDRDNICCVDEDEFTLLPDGSVETVRLLDTWLGFTPSFSLAWEF